MDTKNFNKESRMRLILTAAFCSLLSFTDIYNLIILKYDLSIEFFYFPILILLIFLIFILNFRSCLTSKANFLFFYFFIFLFFFCLIEWLRGLAFEPARSSLVFLSYISFAVIFFLCNRLTIENLFFLMWFYIFSAIFIYSIFALLTLYIFGSSQHVMLSNLVPLFFISLMLHSIFFNKKLFGFYFLYISGFLILSIILGLFYTEDGRLQAKVFLFIAIFISYYYFLIPIFKKTIRNDTLYFSLIIFSFFLTAIGIYFFYNFGEILISLLKRENSFLLRSKVALLFINEMSLYEYIFGFGFGSSYKEFEIEYIGGIAQLKSHSGFLSIFYESGLIGLFLLIFIFIYFSGFNKINFFSNNNKIHYNGKIRALFILFLIYYIIINVFYFIGLPLPNLSEQVQYPLLIIILSIFRRTLSE